MQEIIEIFKTKKKFILQGNKEFWNVLIYENGKIINIYGKTLGDIETGRAEISEAKALIAIKEYFRGHSQTWENKKISSDIEILEYWKHEG